MEYDDHSMTSLQVPNKHCKQKAVQVPDKKCTQVVRDRKTCCKKQSMAKKEAT